MSEKFANIALYFEKIFNIITLNTIYLMKKFTSLMLFLMMAVVANAATPILGTNVATVERMYQFVKSQNSSFDREIAEQFIAVSTRYGLRGDIALCQSIIETGWFKYTGGTAVTPDDHNYCGLGVTTLGQKGCQFSTVEEGVTAQVQHLYAYACTKAIPAGETLVDPRFKYVTRGIAPNWEDLSGRWAASTTYGSKIIAMYNDMMAFNVSGETTTPSLKASNTSVSLTGTQGGSAPSTTVTITGANLTNDITYSSSSSAFTVTTSGWNSRTGGTMTISLDTSKEAGSYSGYVAVQSGSTRIEINCTGTITASGSTETPSTVTIPTIFTNDWCYSAADGTSASWMNPANDYTRNMVLKGDNLYVVQRDPDNATGYIRIVNANTGAMKGYLPSTGITNDAYQYASVANMGGTIVACNLAYGATSALKVYSWSGDAATPSVVLETTNHGARSGDLMSASGTINNGKLYFTSNTGYEGKVYVYTVTNGVANPTPSVITLKDASGAAFNYGGSFAVIEIRANEDGTFWATGKNGAPALFNASGTLIRELNTAALDENSYGTSYAPFTYGKYKLAAAVTYKTTVQQGYLNLINVTDGEASATKLNSYPVLGASGVSNGTFVTTALAKVDGSKIHLWTLIPKQGVAKYSATCEGVGVESIVAEQEASISVYDNKIVINGAEVSAMSIYTLTGIEVAKAQGNEVATDNLVHGIYVAIGVTTDGKLISEKVYID